MCLAIPSRVVSLEGCTAVVEARGSRREVSLLLLTDEVAVGDYLLVRAGGLAWERLDEDSARESLRLLEGVLAQDASDVRVW
ncbi:MAG TPA: HypC/HybG/HupF family hydrogenase formation chaperone [Rhodocyclaceae bacterium]|nr:MAG: hydrogenase assembly protein HupF [Betaproteobacteria bacterium CG2_30_68_42]PIV71625.1 MAG: HypC/HybG/HupF family hydrogenase formation chaperone [Rhodocyclales bacterium CG17_big_fil_post_rev_8_21_14_2_50_68_7]PJA56579.1 MAG: HypC/HybG/HupF family hydrogenase formation chaperone [Rhodocyclales bacterium CG_4_9_14_3_um_filter_68_10]HCX32389.1 HypC/HybG/HupF family hydrogenase formation chaperone [Rhodocyclaceae bacterium]